jgi:hypothetical protein
MIHPYAKAMRILDIYAQIAEMQLAGADTDAKRAKVQEELDDLRGALGFLVSHEDEILEGLN